MPAYRRAIQALRRDSSGIDMYHQYAMRPRGTQPHFDGFHRDVSAAGERRAPPEDPSDTQRRQRPRHDSPRGIYDLRHGSLLLTSAVNDQRYDPSSTATQQYSPVRQPFSPSQSYNPPQHNHLPDAWSRRAQNMPNSQQPIFPRTPNVSHQSQAATNHPATLAPLGPNSSGFSSYASGSPPVNSSMSGYAPPLPHMGNYTNYSAPLGGGGLQAPTSAELPLPTSFPGQPPSHAAFSQQLPHLSQFRNPAYTPFNLGPEYGRPDGFYAPN